VICKIAKTLKGSAALHAHYSQPAAHQFAAPATADGAAPIPQRRDTGRRLRRL
jgi:hypothetical protein